MYFERARQFVNEAFPFNHIDVPRITVGEHAGNMSGWSTGMWGSSSNESGNLLFTYLWHVRRSNDQNLKSFWAQMLDTFGNRQGMNEPLIFEREFGRFLLGLPVDAKAEGLTPEQKIVLDVFQGRAAPDPVSVWNSLPTLVPWLFNFLTRGDVSPARQSQIRTELGLEQATPESVHLRFVLRSKLDELIRTDGEGLRWLGEVLEKPQSALWTNVRAQQERSDRGLPAIDLYPDTEQEFQELIAPSLVILGEKLPGIYKSYKESKELVPIRPPSE